MLRAILALNLTSFDLKQVIACLLSQGSQLHQLVKVRELALVWSGDLFRATRFTVLAILIQSVSQCERAMALNWLILSPQVDGEASLASDYGRVFLGVSQSSLDILAKH